MRRDTPLRVGWGLLVVSTLCGFGRASHAYVIKHGDLMSTLVALFLAVTAVGMALMCLPEAAGKSPSTDCKPIHATAPFTGAALEICVGLFIATVSIGSCAAVHVRVDLFGIVVTVGLVLGVVLLFRPTLFNQAGSDAASSDTSSQPWHYCWPTHLSAGQVCFRVVAILLFSIVFGVFVPLGLAYDEALTDEQVEQVVRRKYGGEPACDSFGPQNLCCDGEPSLPAGHKLYLRGMTGNRQQFLYPTMMGILAALLLFFSPQISRAEILIGDPRLMGLALTLGVCIRWLRAYRLAPFMRPYRRVYSYVHHDISLRGTLYNDLLFLIFLYLLVLIWARWLRYAMELRDKSARTSYVNHVDGVLIKPSLIAETFDRLVHVYSHWKVTSFGVGLVFAYLTFVYWNLIIEMGDQHYIPSAVVVHSLWAATWIIISIPLAIAWGAWRDLTLDLSVARVSLGPDGKDACAAVRDLRPIGIWNLIGVSLAAVVAFLAPLLKTFLELWQR